MEAKNQVRLTRAPFQIVTSRGRCVSQNRMAESLVLFDSVINSRWFLRTSIILFLNKIDIFRHKLRRVSNRCYFLFSANQPVPRYRLNDTSRSIRVGRMRIKRPSTSCGGLCRPTGQSLAYTRSKCLCPCFRIPNLTLYCSITQATDTSNIRLVFAAVANTIIKNSLEDTGIL